MADFYLDVSATPDLAVLQWEDPGGVDRPSRISPVNDRQHYRWQAQAGATLRLNAILQGDTIPRPDSTVGKFTMWPIEWPTGAGQPSQTFPIATYSSIQWFVLNGEGHYTFGVRHEDTQDAPSAAAGGVVVVHIDVEGTP